MRSFTSGGKITKKKLFPQIILSIYSWDLGRQVGGPNPNESLSVAGVMNGFWGLYKGEATFCLVSGRASWAGFGELTGLQC